jgi:HD superfamily phosphohydrolase
MPEKIIRDPVHDVIAFRLDHPPDALLFKLINTREFQRLRRIRQLGMASLAYPGADHSRYSHSLGVMETARLMLHQLDLSAGPDSDQSAATLCAALLHDLGHGPFSHVFEHVTGAGHESVTISILSDSSSHVHKTLAEFDSNLPKRVAELLNKKSKPSVYRDMISSQLDADRFDYLLRDNLHTGSRYGDFDLSWLLHALTIADDRLAVTSKGVSAVEAYLQSRYHMYRNVYFHKVVRAAEGMLKLAIQRAARLAVQDRLAWPDRDQPMFKTLIGQRLSTDEFTDLDDVTLQQCLKQWTAGEDPVLARLCNGLLFRKLFKTIDLSTITDWHQAQRKVEAAQNAVAAAGGDPDYDLFYDEPADTPYEIYDPKSPGSEIWVANAQGQLTTFAAISPLTEALSRQLMFRRLHVAEQYRSAAQAAIG